MAQSITATLGQPTIGPHWKSKAPSESARVVKACKKGVLIEGIGSLPSKEVALDRRRLACLLPPEGERLEKAGRTGRAGSLRRLPEAAAVARVANSPTEVLSVLSVPAVPRDWTRHRL